MTGQLMEYCGNGHIGLGCGAEMADDTGETIDMFYVGEYDDWVPMHVECADLAGLEV